MKHGAPLHFAVRHQRCDDIVEFFISKGADLNELLYQNDATSWTYFFQVLPLGTPLHEAASNDDKRMFDLLIRHGADPGVRDSFGAIPELTNASKL